MVRADEQTLEDGTLAFRSQDFSERSAASSWPPHGDTGAGKDLCAGLLDHKRYQGRHRSCNAVALNGLSLHGSMVEEREGEAADRHRELKH